ncbi:dynein regulatory complex protein 8 isoform X1 [Gadus morhua]|uniref:EF-hand domain-containing protein n=1 Tax=Gadus morhua TaxID=8049 RepID=A0A8C4ZGV7_GADMO|nr:dynein regulatory complex protein 8 isoform X1 [Gadus morhua]XP_056463316.1 dynein regulatory complex protein 8 [Gadus chalcogrammus]
MADDRERAEILVTGVHKRINDAFQVFDHDLNKTVDVREIGAIVRSLGCFPTEAELLDIIDEVEEPNGFICFERFLPTMSKILMENKFRPIPEDTLLKAFEVLDQQKKGHLEPNELTEYMRQGDEPFTQLEMEEMLSSAVEPDSNLIYYKDFVNMMVLDGER